MMHPEEPIRSEPAHGTRFAGPDEPGWGATVTPAGVVYRTWSPERERMNVEVQSTDGERRVLTTTRDDRGFHRAIDPQGRAGDRYLYRLESGTFPDPASRAQVEGVHGPSLVVDPHTFEWTDHDWVRPAFRDLVIYELHLGTFTPAGTCRAAIEKLPGLRELGVTAIQILPIAEFPGGRNWGYDGVYIYAPARAYGSPDDLRALVDRAHREGLAVILDVVYNHLGPDGNYLPTFSDRFFNEKHHTPWGRGFNFDGEGCAPVREFFGRNPIYWMEEFHIDGFRLDATHEITDDSERHILAAITDAIHARGGYATAEDERNDACLLRPTSEGGRGFDGVWADDFHHSARVAVTGERQSYFEDFDGTLPELIEALQHGWIFRGQKARIDGRTRGTECADLAPSHFIHCLSNHDQTGNRALGERLHQSIPAETYRALSVLLCLTPYTPLLFMGQEWAASTPFLYFTEHNEMLGPLVTEGRRREFFGFAEFREKSSLSRIPDPQDQQTFQRSKLNWDERSAAAQAATLALYTECLRMRREIPALRPTGRDSWKAGSTRWGAGAVRFCSDSAEFLLIFDLKGGATGSLADDDLVRPADGQSWELLLSSEDERFGGRGSRFDAGSQRQAPGSPETLLLRARAPIFI